MIDFDVEITQNHKENMRILRCSLEFFKDDNLLLKVKNSKTFHEFLTKIKQFFPELMLQKEAKAKKKRI